MPAVDVVHVKGMHWRRVPEAGEAGGGGGGRQGQGCLLVNKHGSDTHSARSPTRLDSDSVVYVILYPSSHWHCSPVRTCADL